MATKCELCGRTVRTGSNVSHSKIHTKRRWMPNVHPATVVIKGHALHGNFCTRCIRSQQKLAA